jgi:hypothetical protein
MAFLLSLVGLIFREGEVAKIVLDSRPKKSDRACIVDFCIVAKWKDRSFLFGSTARCELKQPFARVSQQPLYGRPGISNSRVLH